MCGSYGENRRLIEEQLQRLRDRKQREEDEHRAALRAEAARLRAEVEARTKQPVIKKVIQQPATPVTVSEPALA